MKTPILAKLTGRVSWGLRNRKLRHHHPLTDAHIARDIGLPPLPAPRHHLPDFR